MDHGRNRNRGRGAAGATGIGWARPRRGADLGLTYGNRYDRDTINRAARAGRAAWGTGYSIPIPSLARARARRDIRIKERNPTLHSDQCNQYYEVCTVCVAPHMGPGVWLWPGVWGLRWGGVSEVQVEVRSNDSDPCE
jgi:hypothetical protein